ncbi:MAG: hypothetical protein IJ867_05130 [Clostridia bacterium]|nr:hypothetical protein [Clostridia bacterium]
MVIILVAVAGITGIGKSYYKDRLVEKLGFEKIKILTTREPRSGEKNNEDKIFVSREELDRLEKNGEIAYRFELLGVDYAYTKEALFSKKNTVFEMHYWCIKDFKKICPEMKTIYLLPKDVNIAKNMLKQRNLKPEVEEKRLKEIDEHLDRVTNDKELLGEFDYVLYNNYDEASLKQVLEIVEKMIEEE